MKPKNIGLIGRKQVGKSTAGQYLADLYGYQQTAFADPLRELARKINPVVGLTMDTGTIRYADAEAVIGYEGAKRQFAEYRSTLQNLGVAVRDVLGDMIWVDAWYESVRERLEADVPLVVTDVRFENEADALRSLGFSLARVVRDTGDNDTHVSETQLDFYDADYVVSNFGELHEMHDALDMLVNYRPRHVTSLPA